MRFATSGAFPLSALLVLLAAPGFCHAFEDIEILTQERAKELGVEIRYNAAGPEAVRVELEFEKQGELKGFHRVAFDGHADGRLLVATTLQEEKTPAGRVLVSAAVDRSKLEQFELRIVTLDGDQRSGHVLRLKEFVDLKKIR